MKLSHNHQLAPAALLLTPSNVIARKSRSIPLHNSSSSITNSNRRFVESSTEASTQHDRDDRECVWTMSAAPQPTNAAPASNETATSLRRRRPRKKKSNATSASTEPAAPSGVISTSAGSIANPHDSREPPTMHRDVASSKVAKSRRQNKATKGDFNRNDKKKQQQQQQQHAWWREQLPPDAVDPITLDPLDDLLYPPFSLVGMEPYEPIDWPFDGQETNEAGLLSEELRQRQILEQQWGATLAPPDTAVTDTKQSTSKHRHVNLFDGRALAYYMVSQLQFIDPLNRRDLVRDELVHLDRYLRRHGFLDLNVTEAYDAKGVTLSTAGSAATTATGRALILQQEAHVLLNALFRTHHNPAAAPRAAVTNQPLVTSSSNTTGTSGTNRNRTSLTNQQTNSFMQQYEANQFSHAQRPRRPTDTNNRGTIETARPTSTYGQSGLVIIDDDENPGLRGDASEFVPTSLYSAGHIISRHAAQGGPRIVQEQEFPTLAATATSGTTPEPSRAGIAPRTDSQPKKNLPKANTLSKIGKMVKKTNPEEQQRQWEAREEARRKAALASLNLGGIQELKTSLDGQASTTAPTTALTESLLDRNRAFAEALGVKPATLRTNGRSGWTRPSEGDVQVDEFGNELNATSYPDALVQQWRDVRLDVLLKLEKKLKSFLADDTAASLPLNPMERSLRALVHEYATYWKLHTESFDPEPRRYIHCVKLRDTSAPYPLLTDILQNWRNSGRPTSSAATLSLDHPLQQTAGQPTRAARELPMGSSSSRVPLSLKPRADGPVLSTSLFSGASIGGAPSLSMMEGDAGTSNSRFGILADGRERRKLDLHKRTLPTELPPFEAPLASAGFDASEELERQRERHRAKVQKEKDQAELKERTLAAAFDSEDDDQRGEKAGNDDSESDWEEQKAVYTGDDEE